MRVLIDARKLGDGGIGVYLENLLLGLMELGDSAEAKLSVTALVSGRRLQQQSEPIRASGERFLEEIGGRVRLIEDNTPPYSFAESFSMGRQNRKLFKEHDLFHSPHYTLPHFIGIPRIVTVHDAIHVTHPEKFHHRPVAAVMINSAVRRADHVICVSNSAMKRVKRLAIGSRTPFSVIPNALRRGIGRMSQSKAQQILAAHGIPADSFVFVGSERPHKGFIELVSAWSFVRSMLRSQGQQTPTLLLVGTRYSDSARRRVQAEGLTEEVRFLGDVDLDLLNAIYNGVRGVVVPSRAEGFGFVALEGLSCGAPVVCTPIKALKEVCGNHAWYAEGPTASALARAVIASMSNPEFGETKSKNGLSHVAWYTRQLMARRTLQAYNEVLGCPSPFAHPSYTAAELPPRVIYDAERISARKS